MTSLISESFEVAPKATPIMADLPKEHFIASVTEDYDVTCWGCGLHLLLPSHAPVFKCGWCGALTNQNAGKRECKYFWLRRLRDRCFVCILLMFMLFVICGGVWAAFPVLFSISYFHGIFHSIITFILSVTTVYTFSSASFACAGTPPCVVWGSYPAVGKGALENYTFCQLCSKPKSPRSHHCRSCGMCILDMDHHCPFIGNCVGAANHRHFIALLISVVTSTFYISVMTVAFIPQRACFGVSVCFKCFIGDRVEHTSVAATLFYLRGKDLLESFKRWSWREGLPKPCAVLWMPVFFLNIFAPLLSLKIFAKFPKEDTETQEVEVACKG
ncbi:unnamed protein product [Prunus armeniaca]|uniref:S-acyltransferase n=1 Tax=Prunus armeniaca TaxID=36596 RepID=A0A6J5W7U5_PRUAR|nr:unnamed protein product [Prunus armeniaca]